MLRARDRVRLAQPRAVQMFALGARDAAKAVSEGVELVIGRSLAPDQYRTLVDSVPRLLRLLPKPYDADFPLVPCVLQSGFNDWPVCWDWLRQTFGASVHSVTGVEQLETGVARATVTLARPGNWAVKARLYFDFNSASCNVVPMALAPTLPLQNDYPAGTMASTVFDTLAKLMCGPVDLRGGDIDGKARLNTFCDSLLVRDEVIASMNGLLQPASLDPPPGGGASCAPRGRRHPRRMHARRSKALPNRPCATGAAVPGLRSDLQIWAHLGQRHSKAWDEGRPRETRGRTDTPIAAGALVQVVPAVSEPAGRGPSPRSGHTGHGWRRRRGRWLAVEAIRHAGGRARLPLTWHPCMSTFHPHLYDSALCREFGRGAAAGRTQKATLISALALTRSGQSFIIADGQ